MKKSSDSQRILFTYSVLLALCIFPVLTNVLASPSEAESAMLFGLSKMRLAFAFGILIIFAFFALLAGRSARDREWAEKIHGEWFGSGRFRSVTVWLGGISFGVGWGGIFIPTYYVRGIENYWVRLHPVLLFFLIAGAATLATLYLSQRKSSINEVIHTPTLRGGVILFLICIPVVAFMLYSRFGMYSLDDFWYGAGVPVLVLQLIAAVVGGLIFIQIENKYFKHLDLSVFALLFAVTAFFWAREPLQKSFLFIGPYAPNQSLYPFADAATFDIGSQFALIGQKIFIKNSYFFERPVYPSLLVYLHTFFGQDYPTLMAVQAGIFAIFPALIYLIGKSLNLRAAGFAAALTAMLRGINSIAASNMIDMANAKMILTDFPAAIGVALVILATCEWLKSPAKGHRALWLGGALGFTLMLRTNALILLVLIPIYAFFKLSLDWKKWMFHSLLIVVGVIAITLPWELRNQSLGGQMYGPIIDKFRAVIDTRYTSPSEPSGFILPNLITFQNTRVLSTLYQGDVPIAPDCSSMTCFVPNHFLHNIITSILILPTSPVMDNLRHVVIDGNPYWNPFWDGAFAPWALFFFILNLFLILLGVSVAWHGRHLQGVVPLAIFLFYNMSNAFARTSGGRYIVPMDWIITIYFLLGVLQVILWFVNPLGVDWKFKTDETLQYTSDNKFSPTKSIFILIILMGFGSLIPLSEKLHPERYRNMNADQLLTENERILTTAGLDMQSINSFRQSEDAAVFIGHALYPSFYKMDQGEPIFYPTITMPFPRTTFILIGPDGENGVILPGKSPSYFPHASDVLVIGCKGMDYFDALAVIVLDEKGTIYTREPKSELNCPLQQPVCNNNSVCK